MNIKVCGVTQLKQLQQLEGLNIDFAGLVFDKNSSRYVGDKISSDDLQSTDFDIKKVGVFVNAGYDEIMQTIEEYGLDIVQLHGDEEPVLCEQLSEDIEVIKTFKITNSNAGIDDFLADYDDVCDYYLFGTNDSLGSAGEKFNWNILSKLKIEKPFFLSGGISVDDAEKIKAFKHLDFYGININSRFEKEPGIKDMSLILQLKQGFKSK
jgi:phosphoribosylanthranilate isomerase